MKSPEIIFTSDGSHSLKVHGMDEHYHSTYGAMSESRHVFIEAGYREALKKAPGSLSILEVGMGTGLNVLLTLLESEKTQQSIHYTAIEAFPLHEDVWRNLNYAEQIGDQQAGEWFEIIHAIEWDVEEKITADFTLLKKYMKLQDYRPDKRFDIIYFDAFGPDFQSDMWTDEVFQQIAAITAAAGIFVTYSAKGSVRRSLINAGFEVERIPGPEGKREMLRGVRC